MTTRAPREDATYIAARRLGEATITVVSDGMVLWAPHFPVPEAEWRRELPDADAEGRVWFGLNVVLIEIGGARIVVDPALDDPGTSYERDFARRFTNPDMVIWRTPGLGAALSALGWAPETVSHVLITHAHGDHYAGVVAERAGGLELRFPRARLLIGRGDWEGNPDRARPDSEVSRRIGAVERAGLLEMVEGERVVVPGVTLLPAPGESPGHQIVRVESGGERLYLIGDLSHHASEIRHPTWAPASRDLAALSASRERYYALLAREGALAIPTHEPFPGWGYIVATESGYDWRPA